MGFFAFLWGWKWEKTGTWFGMLDNWKAVSTVPGGGSTEFDGGIQWHPVDFEPHFFVGCSVAPILFPSFSFFFFWGGCPTKNGLPQEGFRFFPLEFCRISPWETNGHWGRCTNVQRSLRKLTLFCAQSFPLFLGFWRHVCYSGRIG